MLQKMFRHPVIPYTLLGFAIMGPLLLPGYVLTLDMVFGPQPQLPNEVTASYPFYLLIKGLGYIIPVWLIQKLLLLAIVVVSGLGAHRLTLYILRENPERQLGAYFAGILYIVNPFTYVRFMDGHFAVLLGYALLPFFAKSLLTLLTGKQLTFKQALKTALYASLCIIFSIHAIGYVAIMCLVSVCIFAAKERRVRHALTKGVKYLGIAGALVLALNSYWLLPHALGNTPRESLIQNFDMRHFLSFRTDGATDAGVVANTITMHGYWGDREGRYIVPKNSNPVWPVLFATLFLFAMYGLYRTRNDASSIILAISACFAIVLAIGIAATPFNYLNTWLIETLPFFRGFREPQKFVSLLAMFYAVLGGAGVAHIMRHTQANSPWLAGIMLVLPFLYTPTLLGGFVGQLHASNYPPDWAQANAQYISSARGKILFLPWHQYMYFDFAGRVIANPAPVYFGSNVIAGDNPEIGLIQRQSDNTTSQTIELAIASKDPYTLKQALDTLQIEYVILSKTADWQNYALMDDTGLEKVQDTETLRVYKNPTFEQQL